MSIATSTRDPLLVHLHAMELQPAVTATALTLLLSVTAFLALVTYIVELAIHTMYVGSSGSCTNGVESDSGHCYSTACLAYSHNGTSTCTRSTVQDFIPAVELDTDCGCYFDSCPAVYAGICFMYKTAQESYDYCSGVKSPDGYCYHDMDVHS